MKKIVIWSLVSLMIAGIAVDTYLWLRKPQTIALSNGTKLTLIGVTYGTHHVAPKIKINGKLTRGNNGGAQINSAEPALVVWVEVDHKANDYQWQNTRLFVYDRANTACVSTYQNTSSQVNDKTHIVGYMLTAFPRSDSSMIVRLMSNGNGGNRLAKEQFVIANPKRVSIPKWTPESLPNKQTDGDLAVTLTKLEYGTHQVFGGQYAGRNDPANKSVLAVFHAEQNGVAATNWQPIRIETFDASGNHGQNNSWSTGRDPNGDATMTYQWGLWPNQPWKVKVEMSKSGGFSSDELWSITNLPVAPGNQNDLWNFNNNTRRTPPAFAETTLNGIHLKIYPALQFTNYSSGNREKPGGFVVQADKTLDGMQLSLAAAADENGREIPFYSGNSWGGTSAQIQLRDVRNAKALNVTMAFHKSHSFQFTVKPTQQGTANNN